MANRIKNEECRIILDMLPTYADGLASETSKKIVEDHLAECDACRAELERVKDLQSSDSEDVRKAEKAYLRHLNAKRRRPLIIGGVVLVLLLGLAYLFVPGVLGDKSITADQVEQLMEQYAQREELYYEKWFPDKWFAACHIYGIKESGDELLVYAHVLASEFVKLNDKAYDVSGSRVPCVLHAAYKDGDRRGELELKDVEEPKDGELYMSSLLEMYPLRYYLRYDLSGADTADFGLKTELAQKVQKEWRVEVSDDLLQIDVENKTYQIDRVIKEGADEKGEYFIDWETIEEGELK